MRGSYSELRQKRAANVRSSTSGARRTKRGRSVFVKAMAGSIESPDEEYDCVVIGSGIGGLSCASLLARYGNSVKVFESHYLAGGCCHMFDHKTPEGDLYKFEVFSLADSLGVIQESQEAAPTDGLWDDGRTDEDQIGATYQELEWAMREVERPSEEELDERQKQVMERYLQLNKANSHKMNPIPVFKKSDR